MQGNDVDPGQQHNNVEYDSHSRFPQDGQYENQFFWSNSSATHTPQALPNARATPSVPMHSFIPPAQVTHAYSMPPASITQQQGVMLPGAGNTLHTDTFL